MVLKLFAISLYVNAFNFSAGVSRKVSWSQETELLAGKLSSKCRA